MALHRLVLQPELAVGPLRHSSAVRILKKSQRLKKRLGEQQLPRIRLGGKSTRDKYGPNIDQGSVTRRFSHSNCDFHAHVQLEVLSSSEKAPDAGLLLSDTRQIID